MIEEQKDDGQSVQPPLQKTDVGCGLSSNQPLTGDVLEAYLNQWPVFYAPIVSSEGTLTKRTLPVQRAFPLDL
jgi:hypothetical protein